MHPPEIETSTREERERYIAEAFRCKNDCEACGICKVYRGKSPEIVFAEYIAGTRDFVEINMDYR